MNSILKFASYLADEIHNGLIGINMDKVDKFFWWYSFFLGALNNRDGFEYLSEGYQ